MSSGGCDGQARDQKARSLCGQGAGSPLAARLLVLSGKARSLLAFAAHQRGGELQGVSWRHVATNGCCTFQRFDHEFLFELPSCKGSFGGLHHVSLLIVICSSTATVRSAQED